VIIAIGFVGNSLDSGEPQDVESKTSSGSYSVELTAAEKSKVRTIQNSCDTQGALASLSNEEVGRIFKEKCQQNVDGMIVGYKKPKVIKIAIDNHDLNACNLLKTIDGCVMAFVEKFKEIEACDVLDSKDDCVTTFAIDSQDSTACNSLIDNTSCITSYSLEFKEPNTCFQAIDSQTCLESLVPEIGVSR